VIANNAFRQSFTELQEQERSNSENVGFRTAPPPKYPFGQARLLGPGGSDHHRLALSIRAACENKSHRIEKRPPLYDRWPFPGKLSIERMKLDSHPFNRQATPMFLLVRFGTNRCLPAFRHSYSHFRGDAMRKFLLGGLLATTMLIPAFAADDMWRSSKLIGLNVYNDQNEKLGDISEILMDKSGKVDGVIIGVGGFLGMGQHDIKVEMSKLKFVNEPVRTSSTPPSPGGTTGSATPPANRPAATTASSTTKKWYPDHAVLSGATKDSLKGMPEFKYD
jgi:sporulation protein YlmC with PRC-barrel domain